MNPKAVCAHAKAKKALRPLQPLAALAPKLPSTVRFVDVPGTSSGMTLLSVDAGGAGRALFVDEILGNSPHLIGPAPFKFLFWITGSGPGLARNKVWSTFFAKDKNAIAATLLGELDTFRPTILLPAHGNPIGPDDSGKARALIAALG